MNITSSPDISVLEVQVLIDLSTPAPTIKFTNQSTGAHMANVTFTFEVYNPNNIKVYTGDLSTVWTVHNPTVNFPTFQKHIEWSGNSPYRIVIKAKDSVGSTFTLPEKLVIISEPKGNKNVGGNYGEAIVNVVVDCNGREAHIRDQTPYGYQGKHGKLLASRTISVINPPDPTGVFPAAETFNGFSSLVYPLTMSGKGFRATIQTPVDYEFDNNVTVRILYIKTQGFNVMCNYDLCPLLYEFQELLDKALQECDERLDRKVATISAMILQAVMIKMQPTCPADLGKLIEEIKDFAGWGCDCSCDGPIGLNGGNLGGGGGGALNVQFNTGGDITASPNVSGNNIVLNVKDISYIIRVGAATKNRSFSFTPSSGGDTKTYELNVDLDFLAADLIQKIGSVPALLDSFNALVKNTFNFTVDGKCVINTNPACKYTLFIDFIPTDAPLSALFKSITIGEVIHPVNINFNSTAGLTAIQAKLNSLGKGNFVVAAIPSNGGTTAGLQILTLSNPNVINSATVFGVVDATDRTMTVTKSDCAASQIFTPSQIVQAMIDYLCKINATQVKLGYDFVFASMDADGKLKNVNFKSTDSLQDLIKVLNDNASIAISLSNGNKTISCESLQAVLDNKTNTIKPTDTLFGLRDGKCGQWAQTDIARSVISTIIGTNDATMKADWCKAVNLCVSTSSCNPITQGTIGIGAIKKEDFFLVGTNLVFDGFYTNVTLGLPTTVNLQQVDGLGNLGATGTILMPFSTNVYNNAVGALPALANGFTWKVIGITGNATTYLRIDFLNNSAPSYKVAYRLVNGAPYAYSTYPAQAGQFTRLVFSAPPGNYEGSVIAVCGANSESVPFSLNSLTTCPAMNTFSVVRSGDKFIVTYGLPTGYTSFNLVMEYANGGKYDQNQTGAGSGTVEIPIPTPGTGDFVFRARVICDLASSWFGPFTNAVTVNVPTVLAVSPLGLIISNIGTTTATATAGAPNPAPPAQSITLVITPVAGGLTQQYTQAPNLLVWNLVNLQPSTQYNAKVYYTFGGAITSAPFDGGNFTTLPVNPALVLFGWTPDQVTSANVDTFILQRQQTLPDVGEASYNIDVSTGVPQFRNFIIRESKDAPLKTGYINALNVEDIPNYTFAAPVVKGAYRYYFTNGPRSFEPTAPLAMRS